jgi:Uncharacterised protein family (UPF0236)
MKELTGLMSNLIEAVQNIIAMNPSNIQELESGVRQATIQIGAQLIKFKLEDMDKSLTKPSKCRCKALIHTRKRCRQILSTFGTVDIERTMSQCPGCGQTRFALDEKIGLEPYTRVTPILKRLSVLCAASWSYKLAKDVLDELLGIDDVISTTEIRKLCMSMAQELEHTQQPEHKDLRFDSVEFSPSRIYVDVDGGMVNSWDETQRMEGKAAVLWSKKIKVKGRNEIMDKLYIGTFNNYEDLVGSIYCDLSSRTGGRINGVELVLRGDGASWIRQIRKDYFPWALCILDWYHLVKKIRERLDEAFKKQAPPGEIEQELKDSLYEGKIKEAIDKLHELKSTLCVEGKEAVEKLISYIKRNQEGIWYKEARERGIDIGVGTAEKAVDLVICRRFKQRGMIWTRHGANALIKIRLLVLNKTWNQYWDYKLAA